MRQVRLTFITSIPDADTDDQAYLMADVEVSLLDPPGNWEFSEMEIRRAPFAHRERNDGQIRIQDYDQDGNLVTERFIEPRSR